MVEIFRESFHQIRYVLYLHQKYFLKSNQILLQVK
jgi:hypothetical protein